ncbi:hypothetical protein GQ53DRAFT_753022 [Thozetella sp. PMI_491]|nr:hypothetical protein GQ53DRAFT_753022 [Thozetella sp. PMI_491]
MYGCIFEHRKTEGIKDTMRAPPKFVPDSPFGASSFTLEALLGPEAPPEENVDRPPAAETPLEQVWPHVPASYAPAPDHLDDAVREVGYIVQVLRATLHPTPLPEDDLDFCSDLLLSLETRDDITSRVIGYADADSNLSQISSPPHGDPSGLAERTKALRAHWSRLRTEFSETRKTSKDVDPYADVAYPPLVTSLPAGKPEGWRLQLDEHHAEEANRLHAAWRSRRVHALAYFSDYPPQPMGWIPLNDDAWTKTDRNKISAGDLYHSSDWEPMYMGFEMQLIDIPFEWKHPDEKEQEAQESALEFHIQWMDKMRQMSKQREEWAKSQAA